MAKNISKKSKDLFHPIRAGFDLPLNLFILEKLSREYKKTLRSFAQYKKIKEMSEEIKADPSLILKKEERTISWSNYYQLSKKGMKHFGLNWSAVQMYTSYYKRKYEETETAIKCLEKYNSLYELYK